jgi:hypothetical protein
LRPKSVILAERLYGLAILLLLVLPIIGLAGRVAPLSGMQLAGIGLTVFIGGLLLLLLVLAARRGSRVALWLLMAMTALNAAGLLKEVAEGALPGGLFGVLTTVQVALTIVAMVLLFRPNARNWFAEQRVDLDEDEELPA